MSLIYAYLTGAKAMATPTAALPDERQNLILKRLARHGRVLAVELARDFGTSEDTIRRDLRELASAGHCRRVYGGALPLAPSSGTLAERVTETQGRKTALAGTCAKLVAARLRPGGVLFLDAGSTNIAIARALPADLQATVVTNAPDIAALLMRHSRIELLMIGGRVDRRIGAAVGARAIRDAHEIGADLAILGTCAVSALRGISEFDAEEAEFKKAMAAGAATVIAAVLMDRLGTRAPFAVIPSTEIAILVTEPEASPSEIAALAAMGVEIVQG